MSFVVAEECLACRSNACHGTIIEVTSRREWYTNKSDESKVIQDRIIPGSMGSGIETQEKAELRSAEV